METKQLCEMKIVTIVDDKSIYHVLSQDGAFVGWIILEDGHFGFNQESEDYLLSEKELLTIAGFINSLERNEK